MANTTLETYKQDINNNGATCMDCHMFASIAQPQHQMTATVAGQEVRRVMVGQPKTPGTATPHYASDYSFIFSTETTR